MNSPSLFLLTTAFWRVSQVALVVKNPLLNAGDTRDLDSFPRLGRFPQRKTWQPTPVLLPGKAHGKKSPVGYSSWGCKESDTTERLTSSWNNPFQLWHRYQHSTQWQNSDYCIDCPYNRFGSTSDSDVISPPSLPIPHHPSHMTASLLLRHIKHSLISGLCACFSWNTFLPFVHMACYLTSLWFVSKCLSINESFSELPHPCPLTYPPTQHTFTLFL